MELGPDNKTQKIIKNLNYDNTPPVDENGTIIEFDTTIADKNDKAHQKHTENRKKNNN